MTKILSYFNPCTPPNPDVNDRFNQLSAGKKFITVAATAFVSIATLFMGGLGGLVIYRLLVDKWKPINLEQVPGKTPQKVDEVAKPVVAPKKDADDIEIALDAINAMGLKLFQNRGLTEKQNKLPENIGSLAIAPSCLLDLLALAFYAIPEEKRDDYFKSLNMQGMKTPTVSIVQAMKALIFDGKEEGKIAIARLFGTTKADIPEHLQKNQNMYDLKIVQGKDMVQKANEWIDEATKGKIKNIFDGNAIKILASAFYFKLNWTYKFKKEDTKDMDFTLYNGQKVQVATMYKHYDDDENLRYYNHAEEGYQLLELPYKAQGRKICKLIVLPNEGVDILEIEKKFDPDKAMKNLKPLANEEVMLSLPRTKMDWGADNLFPLLSEMGIPCEEIKKDFDRLMMKVIAETNEEGSEVAAVAAMVAESAKIAQVIDFNVNRSFMSFIMDQTNEDHPVMVLAEDFIDEKPFEIKK